MMSTSGSNSGTTDSKIVTYPCFNCGAELQSDATFYVSCGASHDAAEREVETAVAGRCQYCETELDAATETRFCSSCGEALGALERRRFSYFRWRDLIRSEGRFCRLEYAAVAFGGSIAFAFTGAWMIFIGSDWSPVFLLVWLPLLIVFFGVATLASVRRLHDIGYSAWFLLLAYIPYVGPLFYLYLLFAPGKVKGNRWARPKR